MNRLIVVGASTGGVEALLGLTARLPAGLPAAVLIVLHIGAHRSLMPELIARNCPLDVGEARDGEEIVPGSVRTAPSDQHLVVDGAKLRLLRGPKEHHSRPAVDPLFRSAALAHTSKVVGVVLTGHLDDGTAGLQAIKAAGGVAVVQDPASALAPSMPRSALRHVEVDHCVELAEMPSLLTALAGSAPEVAGSLGALDVPRHEFEMSLRRGDPMEHLTQIGTPSPFACPDCHGGLWEIQKSKPTRFRCHTGHAFTIRSLQDAMGTMADDAGWNALRAIQERQAVLREMLRRREALDDVEKLRLQAAVDVLEQQAKALRAALERGPDPIA